VLIYSKSILHQAVEKLVLTANAGVYDRLIIDQFMQHLRALSRVKAK